MTRQLYIGLMSGTSMDDIDAVASSRQWGIDPGIVEAVAFAWLARAARRRSDEYSGRDRRRPRRVARRRVPAGPMIMTNVNTVTSA